MKGEMREKIKRDRGEKSFFSKYCSRTLPKMFRKNPFSDENFFHFFFESSESDRVLIYLHDSKFDFSGRRN